MKATKLLLAAALATGLATLSFAGPGPQFWAQQAKKEQPVKAQPAAQVAACTACAGCSCAGMKKS